MKVVWVWNNTINNALDLQQGGHPLRIALLVASIHTWSIFYPEDEKFLYVDKDSVKFLYKLGLHRKCNIVSVPFEYLEKPFNLHLIPHWGSPRNLVAATQLDPAGTDPVMLVDTDTVVLGDFKAGLSLSKAWVYAQYSMINLEKGQKLIGLPVELDSRCEDLPVDREGYNMSFTLFPAEKDCVQWARQSLDITNILYTRGCFEGIPRKTVGKVPWQYVMLSDECLLHRFFREKYNEKPVLLYEEGLPVLHVTKKYNFKEDVYWNLVEIYSKIGDLNFNLLKRIKNPQGIEKQND